MTMRQEVDVMIFFNVSPKRAFMGKIKVSPSRGVHCDNIRNQRAGKYRVIYSHKRKKLRIFLEVI
jgi:hypothetical protein